MKFLDKKGKLFGKINIIDFCVIIIVIVLIAGAVYKFKFMDKTSNNVAMQPITYTVKVEKVRDYALNNIEIGDTLFDKTSGNAIGTITNVESEPATDNVENRINIILTVEAEAVENSSGCYVNRTYELLMGTQKKFMTKYFECDGYINSIQK